MDASRLVAEAERVMGGSPQPDDVIAEAWQAFELTEAVARLLADHDRQGQGQGYGIGHRHGDGRRHGEHGEGRPPLGLAKWAGDTDPGRPEVRAGPGPVSTAAGAAVSGAAGTGPLRAARLTGVRDPAATVRALRALLGEIGLALVAITCTAEDETAYWQCIEALDAVDEAKDRLRTVSAASPG